MAKAVGAENSSDDDDEFNGFVANPDKQRTEDHSDDGSDDGALDSHSEVGSVIKEVTKIDDGKDGTGSIFPNSLVETKTETQKKSRKKNGPSQSPKQAAPVAPGKRQLGIGDLFGKVKTQKTKDDAFAKRL